MERSMTRTENSTSKTKELSIGIRMLAGAAVGFVLISFFVFGVDQANPAWGEYWRIRPLIVTPLAGAMGGLVTYLIMHYHKLAGANKIIAIILSVIAFVISLWLGIVLGLDGTMWD